MRVGNSKFGEKTAQEHSAAKPQPNRSADSLVRRYVRPLGASGKSDKRSCAPTCGQGCPRSGAGSKILADCDDFGPLQCKELIEDLPFVFFAFSRSCFRLLALAFVFLSTPPLYSATNISAGDELPKLRPPRGEIPPTFWEKNQFWVILSSIAVLALIAAIIWLVTRPKPPVFVPPEVRAKQALDLLLTKPEDGLVLSQVSQVLRHYVTEAFALPPGELTTAEFCRVIASHDGVGSDLASTISDFLRRCDERKFTPTPPAAPMGAVAAALKLIETAQARVAELRRRTEQPSAA